VQSSAVFWFASFAWMIRLSVHLQANMLSLHIGQPTEETLASFVTTLTCAWGCPLVVVGVCAVFRVTGHFGYGGKEGCWIADPLQLGLAFGLPIGLSMAVNVILFALTAFNLCKAMDEAGRATTKYNALHCTPSFLC
jgi:hypothetical protein